MEFNLFRLLQRYALLCLLLIPVQSWSLGLGDLTVESLLGYPLRAKIELLAAQSDELASLSTKLASSRDFDWVGIERRELLNQLEFSAPIKYGDSAYISVTTKDPVSEPVLNFLVEAKWATGRLLREYTINLEPADIKPTPVTDDSQAPPIEDVAQRTPENNAVLDNTDVRGSEKSTEQQAYITAPGDTLSSIARKFLPETLTDNKVNRLRMMIAMLEANPDAFIDNNINGLKSNANLRIPAVHQVEQLSQDQVITEVMHQNEHWRNKSHRRSSQPTETKGAKANSEPQKPVKPPPMSESETVAKALKAADTKESEASESIPEDEQSGTDSVLTKQNTSVDQQSENSARLSIVSEEQTPVEAGSFTIASSEYVANLERSVTLAQELAESRRLESEEIKSRIGRLESIIAQQERLINLQNDQMSELNERLRILSQPKEEPDSNNWLWLIGAVMAVFVLLIFFLLFRYIELKKSASNL